MIAGPGHVVLVSRENECMNRPDPFLTPRRLRLHAAGRLHLGFLDPSASLGRRFGSLGLVIDGFETVLELSESSRHSVGATTAAARAEVERASAHLHVLRERTGLRTPLHLQLREVLPAHAGLGSGTQLALAVGRAFAHWHGLEIDTPTLARWLARGLRSGIGIAGFDQGGLLLDGGPGADGRPAPLLSRVAWPQAWSIVVVTDTGHQGLSGLAEKQAIASLPELTREAAADICHQVLMRVLPGAASGEFEPFALGLNRVQQVLGEHFAPAQGGQAFTSAAVGRLVHWLGERAGGDGSAALGQSSWGPTGFILLPEAARAQALVAAASSAGVIEPGLQLRCVQARNQGARLVEVSIGAAPDPQDPH